MLIFVVFGACFDRVRFFVFADVCCVVLCCVAFPARLLELNVMLDLKVELELEVEVEVILGVFCCGTYWSGLVCQTCLV